MNILIVDDNTTLADGLCRAISRWQHQVSTVSSGKEATASIHQHHYDLILLDIFLPDGKGFEWIPVFKRQHPAPHIITMTGYNTPELEKTIRTYGITYFMTKPISQDELKTIIDHLSIKQQQKEASHDQPATIVRPASAG